MIYFVLAVTALSLLLYATESSWGSVLSAKRNDLVFENRLHEYGAYQIRKDHPRTMLISMFVATGLALGLGFAFSAFSTGTPQMPQLDMGSWIPVDLTDDKVVDMVEEKKAAKQDAGAAAPAKPQTQDLPSEENTETVEVVEDEPAKPWVSAEITREAPSSTTATALGGSGNGTEGGTGAGKGKENEEGEGGEEVKAYAQILPEFPGGESAMRAFLKKHFRLTQMEIERGVTGTMWFTFVVRKDGSVSNVTLSRGIPHEDAMAERAMKVIQSMPVWKPGYTGDKPVNVRYSIPIKIELR
jgi:protein TonB